LKGCYIDGSHYTSDYLSATIVRFATELGWDGGQWEISEILDAYVSGERDAEGICVASEPMYDASEDAVQWMNDHRTDDQVWWIEDNSLYLTNVEDDDV
jgi:hypothetical protein